MGMDERCQYVLSAWYHQSPKATPLIFIQPFELYISKKQSRLWLVQSHTMLNDTEISDLVYSHPNSSSFQSVKDRDRIPIATEYLLFFNVLLSWEYVLTTIGTFLLSLNWITRSLILSRTLTRSALLLPS